MPRKTRKGQGKNKFKEKNPSSDLFASLHEHKHHPDTTVLVFCEINAFICEARKEKRT